MNDAHMTPWPAPSRRRLWLALYLDYLLIGGPLEILLWALDPLVPGLRKSSFLIRVAVVSVLDLALLGRHDWSPGRRALGIVRQSPAPGAADAPPHRRPLVVDPRLLAAERWWTVLLGVYLVLDGTKLLMRWTLWSRPMPFLGMALDAPTSAVFQVMLGIVGCVVGVGVLRLRARVVVVGVVLMGLVMLSTIASWSLLPEWITHEVAARREVTGRVGRPGEVEFMKALVPVGTVVASVLTMAWLGLVLRRARRMEPEPG